VIYSAGLGLTTPAVPEGTTAPAAPLAGVREKVQVIIGAANAPVAFAGLVPGLVGVYQVNATVPQDVQPGDQVPVVLTVSGQLSPPAAISVR
jgi:uncharacterized protein (TIGR03437 family)